MIDPAFWGWRTGKPAFWGWQDVTTATFTGAPYSTSGTAKPYIQINLKARVY